MRPRELAGVRPIADARELAAQLVRSWSTCASGVSFPEALPSLVAVAEVVNPRLAPEAATKVWRSVAESPCAQRLPPDQRAWIELFEAIGARDAARMVQLGTRVLDATPGMKSAGSELAFLAAVTGTICLGNTKGA